MAALGYWAIGTKFLGLAEAAIVEMVDSGNPWVLVGDESVAQDYDNLTKWSDHAVGIPVVFNFLHGVELMLKGFLALKGEVPTHHRLSQLLSDFEQAFGKTELGAGIRQAIEPLPNSPLGRFLQANGISVDDWYQALKYPESTKHQEFFHTDLKNAEQPIGLRGIRRTVVC